MRSRALTFGVMIALYGVSSAASVAAQGSGSQAAGVHACSLLSDADIVRVTGRPNRLNVPPERSEMPNGATTCNFVGLDITLYPRVTPQNFQAMRKTEAGTKDVTVESTSGVGDEAYFSVRARRTSSNVGIIVRRGTYQVALGDRVPNDSVAWIKPKLVDLVAPRKLWSD